MNQCLRVARLLNHGMVADETSDFIVQPDDIGARIHVPPKVSVRRHHQANSGIDWQSAAPSAEIHMDSEWRGMPLR